MPTKSQLQAMVKRSALVFVLCALWLDACSNPARKVERYAQEQGFQTDLIAGSAFQHRVYRAHAASLGDDTLHIYIEGDGSPFADPATVTSDPTPRDPLMLRLMALDPSPSVYLGRPCYFDLHSDGLCNPLYWTVRRFSPEVVDSLTTALRSEAARVHATRLEIYGHSGGATLAVLLAGRIPEVTQVVTIGANLDIDAWSAMHGYTSLAGSLNPMGMQWHRAPPQMMHLVGSEDKNTPPALVQAAVSKGTVPGNVRVIEGYTHNCCWERIWPSILRDASGHSTPTVATSEH